MAFVARQMFVHDAPQALDRVQMGAVSGNEVQLDAPSRLRQPLLHEMSVVIARIVEKHVDHSEQGIHRFDRFKQPDRRRRIDGFNVDHRSLAGLKVDRAVNVEALAPARLLDGEIFLGRRPAADRTRRVRWMHRVHEQHGLVGTKRIQKILVSLDERLLLFHVELAPDRLGLAVFEPEPMQQSDEPRAALIDDAELPLDIGADLARRARQGRPPPSDKGLFLRLGEMARAAADLEALKPLEPLLVVNLAPASDCIVVEIKRPGAPSRAPLVQKEAASLPPAAPRADHCVRSAAGRAAPRVAMEKGSRRESCSLIESTKPLRATNFRSENESGYTLNKTNANCARK